jgi:hypothetical protein
MRVYTIDVDAKHEIDVPEEIQLRIIRDYLKQSYHWVIGTGSFLVGLLIGLLAK